MPFSFKNMGLFHIQMPLVLGCEPYDQLKAFNPSKLELYDRSSLFVLI